MLFLNSENKAQGLHFIKIVFYCLRWLSLRGNISVMGTLELKDSEAIMPIRPKSEWSLYMIKTRMNTLYTGISLDVERRFKEHSGDNKRGARYLKGKGPLELIWQECVGSKSDALSLEYQVKKLNRRQKQSLIEGQIDLQSLAKKTGIE